MDIVFLIGWFIIGPLLPIALHRCCKNLLRSIRFIAIYIAIYIGGISVILWISTKDSVLLLVGIIISIWGGLQILLLPKISPQLVKMFDLKW